MKALKKTAGFLVLAMSLAACGHPWEQHVERPVHLSLEEYDAIQIRTESPPASSLVAFASACEGQDLLSYDAGRSQVEARLCQSHSKSEDPLFVSLRLPKDSNQKFQDRLGKLTLFPFRESAKAVCLTDANVTRFIVVKDGSEQVYLPRSALEPATECKTPSYVNGFLEDSAATEVVELFLTYTEEG